MHAMPLAFGHKTRKCVGNALRCQGGGHQSEEHNLAECQHRLERTRVTFPRDSGDGEHTHCEHQHAKVAESDGEAC